MDATQNLRIKRREKVKNEAEAFKIKRKSSMDKDVGALRLKDGLFLDDDDEDESEQAEKFEDENEDNDDNKEDNDMEGSKEDANIENKEESEDYEGKRENSVRNVSHGVYLVEGNMGHSMEDYLVAKTRNVGGYELGLYAIFDGHSGRQVAKYLQIHLFDRILSEPDFWRNPKDAIKRAFTNLNDEILENVVGARGGSTAVAAILVNGKKLIVANVGDSRAISCSNGVAKQITVDHEPHKEKKMVESRGGFVSQKPDNKWSYSVSGNVPRVDGQLAMTRAFGDKKLKDHITAKPDIFIEDIDYDTQFVIFASDGLWKVMSNEEAVNCVKDISDAKDASQELVKEALLRESRDDISCIVVKFK